MAQSEPAPGAAEGAIYDLGYRRYEGERRGRVYALWSLYALSVRHAFGFGRGALPKTIAIGLAVLAFLPAVLQIALGALLPVDDFEFWAPPDYYAVIQLILVLFVAAIGSDLVGNDRRSRTLALYFARPIGRDDYALAKIAALGTSLLALTVLPQFVMFGGNALGAANGLDWMRDNIGVVPRSAASGLVLCATFAGLGVLVASYAERRAFALIGVIAIFLITLTVVTAVLAIVDDDAVDSEQLRWLLFASPLHVVTGSTLWIFDAIGQYEPLRDGDASRQIAWAGLPGYVWTLAALAWAAIASAGVVRRYRASI